MKKAKYVLAKIISPWCFVYFCVCIFVMFTVPSPDVLNFLYKLLATLLSGWCCADTFIYVKNHQEDKY